MSAKHSIHDGQPPNGCLHFSGSSAGIAYSDDVPQPGMAKSHYKSDHQRYRAAWHAAHCLIEDCEWCQALCDDGLVIACDGCGHVHHTDWLGWTRDVDDVGRCSVLCPECQTNARAMAQGAPEMPEK